MVKVRLSLWLPQDTVAVAVPGVVRVPILHVHWTRPLESAVAPPRPVDWDCAPLGSVTLRSHAARAEVFATSVALQPRQAGDVTDTIETPVAGGLLELVLLRRTIRQTGWISIQPWSWSSTYAPVTETCVPIGGVVMSAPVQ
jgi:hypothetical protein